MLRQQSNPSSFVYWSSKGTIWHQALRFFLINQSKTSRSHTTNSNLQFPLAIINKYVIWINAINFLSLRFKSDWKITYTILSINVFDARYESLGGRNPWRHLIVPARTKLNDNSYRTIESRIDGYLYWPTKIWKLGMGVLLVYTYNTLFLWRERTPQTLHTLWKMA